MIHFSLFSGIGGFDLASEWAGWKNYLSCEINDFGNKVLKYYWPDAYHHTDIHTLTYDTINDELSRRFGDWRKEPIILTGGFPCQPYSSAGQRKGTEDSRHLWPEMLRVIREVSPDWVVGENVFGLTNWSGGLVFEQVQTDLEACGYEVQPFILPACSVNAPHRRDRVWFVAHRNSDGFNGCNCKYEINPSKRGFDALNDVIKISVADSNHAGTRIEMRSDKWKENDEGREGFSFNESWENSGNVTDSECIRHNGDSEATGNYQSRGIGELVSDGRRNGDEIWSETERCSKITSNTDSGGLERSVKIRWNGKYVKREGGTWDSSNSPCKLMENGINEQECLGQKNTRQSTNRFKYGYLQGNWDGFPTTEPTIRSRNDGISGGLDGITFSKWRNESIKAYGNAIVPQVAYQIFKAINDYDSR